MLPWRVYHGLIRRREEQWKKIGAQIQADLLHEGRQSHRRVDQLGTFASRGCADVIVLSGEVEARKMPQELGVPPRFMLTARVGLIPF